MKIKILRQAFGKLDGAFECFGNQNQKTFFMIALQKSNDLDLVCHAICWKKVARKATFDSLFLCFKHKHIVVTSLLFVTNKIFKTT